jgi:hypothetical protein
MVASSLRTDCGKDAAISAGIAGLGEMGGSGFRLDSIVVMVRRSGRPLLIIQGAAFYIIVIKRMLVLCFFLDLDG